MHELQTAMITTITITTTTITITMTTMITLTIVVMVIVKKAAGFIEGLMTSVRISEFLGFHDNDMLDGSI